MDLSKLLCSPSPLPTPSYELSATQVHTAPTTFVHWTPPYDPPSPQTSAASPPPSQEDEDTPLSRSPQILDVLTPEPIPPVVQSPPTCSALSSSIPEDHGTSSYALVSKKGKELNFGKVLFSFKALHIS